MSTDPTLILSLLDDIVTGRNEFLSDNVIRSIPFAHRPNILTRYMNNESVYMDLISRIYINSIQPARLAAQTLITLNMPMNSSFFEPVLVIPTPAQLIDSLEDININTQTSCAVCQEPITSGACRIRQCGHIYHRACVVSWFSLSVHCPVCRYDIREVNQEDQTSSDEEEMSSLLLSRSEEQNI